MEEGELNKWHLYMLLRYFQPEILQKKTGFPETCSRLSLEHVTAPRSEDYSHTHAKPAGGQGYPGRVRGVQWNQAHRAVEDHTVAVAHTFDVGGEVEADGSVANGVHGLGIKEVVRPRWRRRTDSDENKHSSDEENLEKISRSPTLQVTNKLSDAQILDIVR